MCTERTLYFGRGLNPKTPYLCLPPWCVIWNTHQKGLVQLVGRIERIQRRFLRVLWWKFGRPNESLDVMIARKFKSENLQLWRKFSDVLWTYNVLNGKIDSSEATKSTLIKYVPKFSLRSITLYYTPTHRCNYWFKSPLDRLLTHCNE